MEDIERVMVVCGITGDCSDIVHYAAAVARSRRAELIILTVIYNPFGVKGLSFPRPSLARDYQELVKKVRNDAQAIINREKQQGVPIRHMLVEGKPQNKITALIREKEIDLLVLPAYRQTRLEHLLFGGYNKILLRKMPCSVLFFKSEPSAIEEEEEEQEEERGKKDAAG
jgi:nucleotide-binding universal stress UspA family protein